MERRVSKLSVVVGEPLPLSIAQGEDREYRITFYLPPDDPGYDPLNPTPVNFTGLVSCDLAVKDQNGVEIVQRGGTVVGSSTAGTLSFVFGLNDTVSQTPQVYKADCFWKDGTFETQLFERSPFEVLEAVTDISGPSSQPPPLPIFAGPFILAVAVFDGTSAEAVATWADLGSPPTEVYAMLPVTDSSEAVVAQVIKSSITSTGCTIQINDDIACRVPILVRP